MSILPRPEEAVSSLLKRINQAKNLIPESGNDDLISRFENIGNNLQILKMQFSDVKSWADTVLAKFTQLEHQIFAVHLDARKKSGHRGRRMNTNLNLVDQKIELLKKALPPLAPGEIKFNQKEEGGDFAEGSVSRRKKSEKWLKLNMEEDILNSEAMKSLQITYNNLDRLDLKLCFLCFSIFPEDAAIKKRPLIYWWISEGFVATEEVGEDVFKKLMEFGLIKPHPEDPDKPITLLNGCTVHPWTRYWLIKLAESARLFEFDSKGTPRGLISRPRRACLVLGNQNFSDQDSGYEDLLGVFNVSEKFLDLKPDLLPKSKNIKILQLGGWQSSLRTRTEGVEHHIEVVNEIFLKGLGPQKHLKYLSLRGISRISTLPSSISDLFNLEILDLKACHNLEALPFDISKLRKLTHLDLSDCPLLESMPKGLDKLTNLQVLKGFIIGDLDKTPCRVAHLASMEKLRRLSMYIGAEAVVREGEFSQLEKITSLRCLTITWGVRDPKKVAKMADLLLPENLEKLDLRGIPCSDASPEKKPLVKLDPRKLLKLKRLYIRGGGEFSCLDCDENCEWAVEILQLKYLNDFKIEMVKLLENFPNLIYLEVKCDGKVEANEEVKYKQEFKLTGKTLEKEKEKYKVKGKSKI